MAFDRVKISTLVPSQLPEFVRTEYQTFVQFIQAYYDYMEQAGVAIDMDTIRDIDESVATFVTHLKNEIAPNIPLDIANNRFKASRLKDLYDAKGSASSYKLLFRMLYDRETDVTYPSQQMLIPSDGRWVQPYSIFVHMSEFNGPMSNLVGKLININNQGRIIQTFVERVEPTVILDNGGRLVVDPNTFQIFISKNYFGTIDVDNTVTYSDDQSAYVGTIVLASIKINIQYGGFGFKVGEIYNIQTATGTGALLKINSVDSEGTILSAQLIGAGINYSTTFSTSIFAKKYNVGQSVPTYSVSFGGGVYSLNLADTTDQLIDYGVVSKYDYTVDLDVWDNSFTGSAVGSFYDTSVTVNLDNDLAATVEVVTGAVVKYPGFFSANNGFLSDALYIQDSEYYQTFSYVVKLDKTLDDYSGVLKTLLHPAGTALFGEFNLADELTLEPTVESALSGVLMFSDTVMITDAIT